MPKAKKPRLERVEVTTFPVGSQLMNELMPLVIQHIEGEPLLRDGLFQVRVFAK